MVQNFAQEPNRTPHTAAEPALSLVIPVYNEIESLPLTCARIAEVLADGPVRYRDYEIILVDDGSTDGSADAAEVLHRVDPRISVIQFRRNYGKTAALQAGFAAARAPYVVTIDADLQEDPAEVFRMLELLDAGNDLVCAWRFCRNDPLSKTLPSRIYNTVVRRVTGVAVHDMNCGFKAYRREVVRELRLYGELHRFIPVLAHQAGFRITEAAVAHFPRRYGKSKFGARRLGRGYLDFIQVLFITSYLRRPLRLFGALGTLFLMAGALICLYLTAIWFTGNPIGDRPLLMLGVLLLITGLQFGSLGLLGEMLRYSSYRSGDEFRIRRILSREEAHTEHDIYAAHH